MKKSLPKLLLAMLLLTSVTLANAQVARSNAGGLNKVKAVAAQQMKNVKIEQRVAQRNTGSISAPSSQRAVPTNSPYYLRPKGTMYVNWAKDGSGFIMPFVNTKPYDEVTWRNYSTASGTPSWGYWLYVDGIRDSLNSNEYDLTVKYGYEYEDCPYLMMGSIGPYTLSGYRVNDALAVVSEANCGVASVINSREIYNGQETNYLASAHYYGSSNRFGTERYGWTFYTGAQGPNGEGDKTGYWFGKNYSGYNVFGCGFEKPVSPYVLNKVYFWTTDVSVTEDVDLECRIYRLSDLPAFDDAASAQINPENLTSDALIATGRTTITTDMNEDGQPILEFTLYETYPGLDIEYETSPVIDDAIVVLILGMDQDAITSMSGLITTDEEDEGVGELTFVGHQEDGVVTALYGINNFFSSNGQPIHMKVGSSILLDVTRPFMVYNYIFETGEYTFPNEGGQLAYDFDTEVIEGIQFYSSSPSELWTVTTDEGDDIPDWLNIELENEVGGESFPGVVTAHVTADALPSGITGRRVVVRFDIHGAYIDYSFYQGVGYGEYIDENGLVYEYEDNTHTAKVIYKSYYNNFTDVVIPATIERDGIEYTVTELAANAFKNCNLRSVSIYANITEGNNGFNSCIVNTLYVANNVTSLKGLGINPSTIYCFGNTPAVCNSSTFRAYTAALHVPVAAMTDYFIADIWCNFNNINSDAGPQPESLALDTTSVTLEKGQTLQLNVNVTPAVNVPVYWKSTNPQIVTVNDNGMLTAITPGEADIIANCAGLIQKCHVTVNDVMIVATIDKDELSIERGSTAYLTASTSPISAEVTWTSTNTEIATVTVSNGRAVVTGVAPGEALIIATPVGANVQPDTCRVIVNEITMVVTIDQHNLTLERGDVAYLTATTSPFAAEVMWTSTDTNVALLRVVNGRAMVLGNLPGEAMIIATTSGVFVQSDICYVTVIRPVGDANNDGLVDVSDVNHIINIILHKAEETEDGAFTDLNQDGNIDVTDVNIVINIILGKI